jgi:hypothetical protein
MIADCRAVIVTDITGEIVDPSVRDSFIVASPRRSAT